MEIRELRVYLAVVDEGSLSAAARRLHVSQSAVSDTIAALERQLGVAILVRNRRGAVETAAGERLTAGARRLVRAHDRLHAEVAAASAVSGVVRVGIPLELPADYLPQVVAAVGLAHPGVRIEGRHAATSAQWRALRRGELEVALVRELAPGDDYDSLLVVEDRLGVLLTAARAAELVRPDGAIDLASLRGMSWNGFARSDTPSFHDHVGSVLRGHGIRVVGETLDDERPITPGVKLAAVADGTRFALALPDFPVTGDVVWHPLAGDPIVRRTWAAWRADETAANVAIVVDALDRARRTGPSSESV